MPISIKIQKIHPDAKTPRYAHDGDAGIDLFSIETRTLQPGERYSFPTGYNLETPDGYTALVWDKGSRAFKDGIHTIGGVFDASYRGKLDIIILNISDNPITVRQGEKIAQLLIQPIERATVEEVEELSETTRSDGRFGSTGLT